MRLLGHQVVHPVVLQGHEDVLVLDVEQVVALQGSVQEEDRGVKPLTANLEPEDRYRMGIVVILVQELKADKVVGKPRGLVAKTGVRQVRKGNLELLIRHLRSSNTLAC